MTSKSTRTLAALVAIAGLTIAGAAGQAEAHHAFAAEFDGNAPVLLRGTVTKVEWINPHAWIHVSVAKAGGGTQVWMVEGGTPNTLLRSGLTRDSVKPGTNIIVRQGLRPGLQGQWPRRDLHRRSPGLHGVLRNRGTQGRLRSGRAAPLGPPPLHAG